MTFARLIPALLFLLPSPLLAADYTITLKDQAFSPKELAIPANEKVQVTVKNEDNAPIEFESHQLKREKVIQPHAEITIPVGPLPEGKYEYYDEFHDGSVGTVVAK